MATFFVMCRDSIRRGVYCAPIALWVGDGVRYPARPIIKVSASFFSKKEQKILRKNLTYHDSQSACGPSGRP